DHPRAGAVGPRPRQALPGDAGRGVPPRDRAGARRRRRLARPVPRRDPRRGRRVGVRQVDARPGAPAPDPADERHRPLRGRGPVREAGRGAQGVAPGHADRAAGPLHLAQPAPHRRRHRGRAVRHPPRGGAEGRPPPAGAGAARGGRAQPRAHPPLPAPVLRRPAPAHRHRPRARPAAQGDRLRRAGVGARRVDPGAGAQPALRPAARVRAGVPVHRPRPRRRAPPLRPRRGDVPGLDRRDRHQRADLHAGEPPVHPGAAVVGARPRPDRAPRAHPAHRRRPQPRRPALGVPLPHPLPEGGDALRGGPAGPRGPGVHRPPDGVPLRRTTAPRPRGV
ncbi:MAG: Oligopeptide transport ATP-binding protein OppF, partial [uncultured Actinomycetospora sp.]